MASEGAKPTTDNSHKDSDLLFEFAPQAMFEVSLEGKLLRVNREACLIFGFEESEKNQVLIQELLSVDGTGFNEFISKVRAEGQHTQTGICLRKDRRRFRAQLTARILSRRAQETLIISFVEPALEKKDQYLNELQVLFNHPDVLLWSVREEEGELFYEQVNHAFAAIEGYAPDHYNGKPITKLHSKQECEKIRNTYEWVKLGKMHTNEVCFEKDGNKRYFLMRFVPLEGTDGSIIRFLGSGIEITSRLQAEEESRRELNNIKSVNELALKLADIEFDADIFKIIGKELKELTGAMATAVSVYDLEARRLKLKHLEIDSPILKRLNRIFEGSIWGIEMPVSSEMHGRMINEVIRTTPDLSETTFGGIPKHLAKTIKHVLGVGDQTGIAVIHEGELMGSIAVIMKQGNPSPSHQLMHTFANVIAVTLKRMRAEQEAREREENLKSINRMAVELESAPPEVNLFELVGRKLKEITGAQATAVTAYECSTNELVIKYLSLSKNNLAKINNLLGKHISSLRFPVTADMKKRIINEGAAKFDSLSELTWGKIGSGVSEAIHKVFHLGEITGFSLLHQGEIVGTAGLIMPKGKSSPPSEVLHAFANVAAMSLRRRAAERALAKSEHRYRTLQTNLPVGVFRTTPEGNLISANPAMIKMLGYKSKDELSPVPIGKIYVDSTRRDDLIKKLYKKGTVEKFEVQLKRRDGSLFWASLDAKAEFDAEGKILHYDGIIQDVSQRIKAEQTVRREREAFSIIAEAAVESKGTSDLCYLVLSGLVKTLGFDVGTVQLYDPESNALVLIAMSGIWADKVYDDDPPQYLEDPSYVGTTVARSGIPIFAPDVAQHPVYQTHRKRLEENEVKSLITWPIQGANNASLGIIQLIGFSIKEIPPRDRFFFETVVGMFATALEQKKSDAALRESERKYRTIVENTRDVIYSAAPNGIMLYVSPNVSSWGYTPREVNGRSIAEFVHPQDFNHVMSDFAKTVDTGTEFPTTFRLKLKNGEYIYVEESGKAIIDDEGKVTGVTGVIRDVTERRKAELALRESEGKYRTIVETTNEGIWVLDSQAKTTYVNERMAEMFGYTPEEMIGISLFEFMDTEFRSEAENLLARRKNGISEVHDFCFRRKDGSPIWTTVSATPLFDQQREFAGALGMVTDITDRRKAEEDLRIKDSAIASSINGMALTDLSGNLTYVNDACLGMWRYEDRKKVLGSSVFEHCGDKRKLVSIMKALRDEGSWAGEVEGLRRDGSCFPIYLTTNLVKDDEGNPLCTMASFVDLSELKEAQKALQESEKRYRNMFELSPEVIIYLDTQGKIKAANPKIYDWVGYKPEEITGKHFSELPFLTPESIEEVRQKFTLRIRAMEVPAYEIEAMAKSGETKIGRLVGTLIKDENDEVTAVLVMVSDITARKRAEEKIQHLNQYLESVIDNANVWLSVLDVKGNVLIWNKAAEKISGYSAEQVVGHGDVWESLYPQEREREQIFAQISSILDERKAVEELETKILSKEGKKKQVSWFIRKLEDEQNNQIGYIIIGRDVTQTRQSKEKERQYINDIKTLSETAIDFVKLSLDEDIFKLIGARLRKLLGCGFVLINSYHPERQEFKIRALEGNPKTIQASFKLIGRSILTRSFPVTEDAKTGLTQDKLVEIPGGIFQLAGGGLPEGVCKSAEKLLGLGDIYAMGFAQDEEILGSAVILLPRGSKLINQNILETFISQASVALQRRAAEQNLVESENLYRTVVETLHEGLGIVDQDENIIFANTAFCKILDYSHDDIIGMNLRNIITPDDWETLTEQTAKRKQGISSHYEIRMLRRDGQVRDMRISAVPIKDEKGKFKGSIGFILDVTEQKLTEKALRESEERYRAFTEEALVGVYIYKDGRYLFANRAMKMITGYTKEELLEMDIDLRTLPGICPKGKTHKGLRNGSCNYSLNISKKNGEEAVLEVRVRRISYGEDYAYLGNCIDITQNVLQQRQIEQAKREWERTFDSITDLVMIVDTEGKLQRVNRAASKYTELDYDQLVGRRYLDVFHLQDKEELSDFFMQPLNSNLPASFEVTDPVKDKKFWVTISPLPDRDGKTIATVAVARDITQMHRMEEALIESEIQFRSLAESVKDIIFSVADDGSILYLNPAFEELMGVPVSEYVGVNIQDILSSSELNEGVREDILNGLKEPSHLESIPLLEFQLRDNQGQKRVLEISVRFFSDKFIGIARDITERKKMYQQLVRASKLASIGVLAAGLGHQINNPLASTLAASTALREYLASKEDVSNEIKTKANQYLETMGRQLERSHKVISSLLDFAKDKKMQARSCDVNSLVREAIQFLSQHLSFKEITLELYLEDGLPEVWADSEALQQAVINVMQNAFEAMGGKGQLTISTGEENGKLGIRISNDGPPIPAGIREDIFDLLFTTKTHTKGTGLGLPISTMLLEHSGGRIYLEESNEEKTTFLIEIPVQSKEEK